MFFILRSLIVSVKEVRLCNYSHVSWSGKSLSTHGRRNSGGLFPSSSGDTVSKDQAHYTGEIILEILTHTWSLYGLWSKIHSVIVMLKQRKFLIGLTSWPWKSLCVTSAESFNLWSVSHVFFHRTQCVYYGLYYSTAQNALTLPPFVNSVGRNLPHVVHNNYEYTTSPDVLLYSNVLLFFKMGELLCDLSNTKCSNT